MVKFGCLILSMVEMNLVGRVNLFLLVLGWAVMFIHSSFMDRCCYVLSGSSCAC